MINPTKISNLEFEYEYTVCTLVTNCEEYTGMLKSFYSQGFDNKNTEFLYVDNSQTNMFDAYRGLNHLLSLAKGRYIILCHQDILLDYNNELVLRKRLKELDKNDKSWALAGNAGGIDLRNLALRITDHHNSFNTEGFPKKVMSLDENFIVVNHKNRVAFSGDLSGFHFYGLDICMMADILGYNSYVIDFHLKHNGAGATGSTFYENRTALIYKYQHAFRARFLATTCSRLFISSSKILNYIFNNKLILDSIRNIYRKK